QQLVELQTLAAQPLWWWERATYAMRLSVVELARFVSMRRHRPDELAERSKRRRPLQRAAQRRDDSDNRLEAGDFSHSGFVSFSAVRVTGPGVRLSGRHRYFASSRVKTMPAGAAS